MIDHFKSFMEYFDDDLRHMNLRWSDHYTVSKAKLLSWCSIRDSTERQYIAQKEGKAFIIGLFFGLVIASIGTYLLIGG